REIGIHVAPGDTGLDVHRRAVAHDAERARAVVDAPRHRGRGEAPRYEALVRVDVGGEPRGQVAEARELTGEEVLHQRRAAVWTAAREHGRVGTGIAQADVHVARVALTLVELRHEREA